MQRKLEVKGSGEREEGLWMARKFINKKEKHLGIKEFPSLQMMF